MQLCLLVSLLNFLIIILEVFSDIFLFPFVFPLFLLLEFVVFFQGKWVGRRGGDADAFRLFYLHLVFFFVIIDLFFIRVAAVFWAGGEFWSFCIWSFNFHRLLYLRRGLIVRWRGSRRCLALLRLLGGLRSQHVGEGLLLLKDWRMQCVLRKLGRPWQLNRLSNLFSLLFQILIAKLLQNNIGFVIRIRP